MNGYEECIAELEQILKRMEAGSQSLEEAMKDYERGLELTKICAARLDEAGGKIEKLTRDGRIELDENGNEISE